MRIPNYLKEAIENYDSATCSGFETYAYQPVSKFESDGTISLGVLACDSMPTSVADFKSNFTNAVFVNRRPTMIDRGGCSDEVTHAGLTRMTCGNLSNVYLKSDESAYDACYPHEYYDAGQERCVPKKTTSHNMSRATLQVDLDHVKHQGFNKKNNVLNLNLADEGTVVCDFDKYFVPGAKYEQFSGKADKFQDAIDQCRTKWGHNTELWLQYYDNKNFNCSKFTSDPSEVPRKDWEKANGRKSMVCTKL